MPAFRLAILALLLAVFVGPVANAADPVPPSPPPAAAPPMVPPPPPSTNVATAVPGLYAIDKNHAGIAFRISHMGFSFYHGRFDNFDATINLDPAMPEKSTLDVTIDMSSIDTHNAKLEGELRDWFKAAQFPTATFKSTRLTKTGPATGELEGNFTMLGQTHPVKLAVTFQGHGLHIMTKKPTMGFSATGVLKRSQWGINQGIPMVGDDVLFTIDAEFGKADAAPLPLVTAPPVAPTAPVPAPVKP